MPNDTLKTLEPSTAQSTSPYASGDSKKFHQAADRALDHYLKPSAPENADRLRKPAMIFIVAPEVDNETLLAQVCELLASANAMVSDLAGLVDGTQRNTMLAIQQVIMLGELAVNRVLDNVSPPQTTQLLNN
ncbi:DUF6124 family protein [Pseudomonas fluorescens]|uniref:Uncharacterized protein n=1 Tax=Pseudomonas fluorescens TaxID=294 RepID=A0A5E7E0R1_PSEFL|nr:DUF6124 family protein [Pseudomonas fluorescens]VVO16824.1 hypothetical protein PS833_03875 [Pseudomonas fluorescens]VVQ03385.1 hypothetical protein PS914_04289 [Pseudomonas fluorescens]